MEVGEFGGARPPRVHHDYFDVGGILLLALLEAAKNDRMAPRSIGADQQEQIGEFDICIASGWTVSTERRAVGRDRTGHTKAAVGVKIVGSEKALRQLVEDVIVFGQELPGAVKGHCVGAVAFDDLVEAVGDMTK